MWRLPATLLLVVTLLVDGKYRQVRAAAFDDKYDADDDSQVGSPPQSKLDMDWTCPFIHGLDWNGWTL